MQFYWRSMVIPPRGLVRPGFFIGFATGFLLSSWRAKYRNEIRDLRDDKDRKWEFEIYDNERTKKLGYITGMRTKEKEDQGGLQQDDPAPTGGLPTPSATDFQ